MIFLYAPNKYLARIVPTVDTAIWESLVGEYMPIPKRENWWEIASDFQQRWNFPIVLAQYTANMLSSRLLHHLGHSSITTKELSPSSCWLWLMPGIGSGWWKSVPIEGTAMVALLCLWGHGLSFVQRPPTTFPRTSALKTAVCLQLPTVTGKVASGKCIRDTGSTVEDIPQSNWSVPREFG